MALVRGRRAQVFIFDFFAAIVILSFVLAGMEALRDEMRRDREEWTIRYDLRASAEAALHHIVDVAAVYETGSIQGGSAPVVPGYALYDAERGLLRPNHVDLERLQEASSRDLEVFFRRLAVIEGASGYGWLVRFSCVPEDGGIVVSCPADPFGTEDEGDCKPMGRAWLGSAAVTRIAVSGGCVGTITVEAWK